MSASKAQKQAAAPVEYNPLNDDGEFMNPRMLAYFKAKLLSEKAQITDSTVSIRHGLRDSDRVVEDNERAALESQSAPDLILAAKSRKLIRSIDEALAHIAEAEQGVDSHYPYGYSVISGEEIPVARLMARPWSTTTIEEQEVIDRKKGGFKPNAWTADKAEAYDL